jgi:predicted secreted protein
MAAQTTPINGTLYQVKVKPAGASAFKAIADETTATLDFSADTLEYSSKNGTNCKWKQTLGSKKGWSISGDAYFQNGATAELTFKDLFPEVGNVVDVELSPVDCEGGEELPGEYKYTGKAVLVSLSPSFPDGELSTYAFSLQGTGPLTQTVVPPTP